MNLLLRTTTDSHEILHTSLPSPPTSCLTRNNSSYILCPAVRIGCLGVERIRSVARGEGPGEWGCDFTISIRHYPQRSYSCHAADQVVVIVIHLQDVVRAVVLLRTVV